MVRKQGRKTIKNTHRCRLFRMTNERHKTVFIELWEYVDDPLYNLPFGKLTVILEDSDLRAMTRFVEKYKMNIFEKERTN